MFTLFDQQLMRTRYQEYNDQFKNFRTPLPEDDKPGIAQRVLASLRSVLSGPNRKRTQNNGYAGSVVAK